jgi:hypothetical protein
MTKALVIVIGYCLLAPGASEVITGLLVTVRAPPVAPTPAAINKLVKTVAKTVITTNSLKKIFFINYLRTNPIEDKESWSGDEPLQDHLLRN